MKSKSFFLLFIFGIFLFLLPNFAEAACPLMCTNTTDIWGGCVAACYWSGGGTKERLGIIGTITSTERTCDELNSCSDPNNSANKCATNAFPSGSNGQSCTARDACWFFRCSEFTKSGVWDAYESQCVTCSGYKEDRILGNTSAVYAGCGSENGNAGDGKCESACGAAAACDEKAVGASCGTGGTCNSSCQCIVPECNSCSVSNMSCPSSVNTGQSFNITFDYYGTGPTGYPYEHRSLWRGTTRIGCKYGNATECSWHSDSFSTTAPTTPGTYTYYVKCYGASSQSTTYCDSADSSQSCDVKVCECTSTTIGGCCDGCNYCPAGKVFNGTSCVDATATVKCASTVNKCTAGSCSGEKRYPECQAGGVCDSSATSYYTSETVYASTGYTLTSTCGTTGTTLCGYSTWNGCNGACQKKRDQLRCDASHNCAYDVGDDFSYLSTDGKVCSGGSEVAPSSSINCDKTINCVDNSCSAARYYRGCTAGATSCTETGKVSYTAWPAPSNYTISETTYKVGDTCNTNQDICGYSTYNKCGGTGSPYSCQKGRDQYRCNGTGSCTQDVGDEWLNVAAGYVCSAGSEIAASATYYCGFSAYNARSADKCDKKKDYLACNGSNVCNYGDYGDAYDYVSANKIANTSGQEVDASSADNTGNCHSCTDGSCSGTLKWSECDGSGNPGPCATYNQTETVYPSAGYTLTSTCGTTGTTNCDTNFCWDGAGHHEKCDRRCNTSHVCDYYNCVNHCTNTIQDCDETGFNCGGSCPSCDTTPPTTTIKVKRKSTGEDLTAAGSWLRADTYTIQFEDKDQADGSGSNCENCSCEYSIYSCDVGGTNCNTVVISLTSRTPNSSFDILAGKTAPTYNLEGAGRYRIYSGAKDMANYLATEYRYINFDFTPPRTEIR